MSDRKDAFDQMIAFAQFRKPSSDLISIKDLCGGNTIPVQLNDELFGAVTIKDIPYKEMAVPHHILVEDFMFRKINAVEPKRYTSLQIPKKVRDINA